MSYTFEEIMGYHPDNAIVYEEIKKSIYQLVPFIGAGLTCFAYGTWAKSLEALANKITDANRFQVEALIREGAYFDAAQLLEDLRGASNLARDIAHLFSDERIKDKIETLDKEAISLLPALFRNLVITTNFDQTLEYVYQNKKNPFKAVILPEQPELLSLALWGTGTAMLFKIHGSVNGDYVDYSRIIFTRRQYEKNYGGSSPLKKALKKSLHNKAMLFLGCSLRQDTTLRFLQEITEPGEYHYAIVSCTREERDSRIREINPIRAILYEENRHEAVQIILKKMLEDIRRESVLQIVKKN